MASDDSTYSVSEDPSTTVRTGIGLRVLAHPDTLRIGDSALLFEGLRSGTVGLGRLEPKLRGSSGVLTGPLDTGHVSRTPVRVQWNHERSCLRLKCAAGSTPVEVDGMRLDGEAQFSLSDVDSGVVVLLGRHVALWIGVMDRVEDAPVVPGLIGESAPMRRLRQQIHRIAPTEMPVLLRGETGVGKEVVAEAIHARSARASNVFVAVNVAGIPGPMAASELFGHRRGAFTGAVEDRPGYFAQANGGTLFLDEIGDVSSEIQTLLLRAIQQGVIQPLGGSARQVDVRLIAATDSDLESAIRRKEFREPLLHRFSLELWVPPLRKRLEDVGLLFFHLLGQHLRKLGGRDRLAPTADRKEPWVPAAFVARLARHSWPGNVRELSNVALKFAVHNRELPRGQIDPELQGLLAGTPPAVEQQPPPAPAHRGEPASDEMIAEAMHAAGYSVVRAADVLGMSRANLYKRLETCRAVTRASDLSATQIADALRDTSGEPSAAARHLRVSLRALVLQMRRLGLDVEDDRD